VTVLAASAADVPPHVDVAPRWLSPADEEREAAGQEAAARRRRTLDEVLSVFDAAGIRPQIEELEDDPADAAIELAKARGISTIITSVGRRLEAEPPLTDEVETANRLAEELLKRAPASVLAIPFDRGTETADPERTTSAT
jgi:hypothetical protein